MQLYNIERK
jgi:clathrin heavy chain